MANESEQDQQAAAGGASLTETIAGLEANGYKGQWMVEGEGIKCLACGQTSNPESLTADAMLRVEGASDPADMAAVAGLRCPGCGTKGTIVLKYGPEASPEDQHILSALGPGPTS
jgi:DNA-directed RNA polymerase subunit RPC12/RpoP